VVKIGEVIGKFHGRNMAVRFILARSGAGKSRYCIEQIADALKAGGDKRLILLVPEQATYQAERALLSSEGIKAYSRCSVVSFNRLRQVLGRKKGAKADLSAVGKQILISVLLRDHAEKLCVLGSLAQSSGLAEEISRSITELASYGMGPEDVEELACKLRSEAGSELTGMKFADIAVIYGAYLEAIGDKFNDPDIELSNTAKNIKGFEGLGNAVLWVDGFSGFTQTEFEILIELASVCEVTNITLCLDAESIDIENCTRDNIDVTSIFYPSEKTYADICVALRKRKIEKLGCVVLKGAERFGASADLGHLERHLFGLESVKRECSGDISLSAAGDIRQEVQQCASKINELVKREGYRFSDIAVIASDLGSYEPYIRPYFDQAKISYFIDTPKQVNEHTGAEFLTLALKIVCGGFSNDDVFAYLKTGLTEVESFAIEQLENYCVAFAIEQKDWQKSGAWKYETKKTGAFDEEKINKTRRAVVGPLLKLKVDLHVEGVAEEKLLWCDFAAAVAEFIGDVGLYRQLKKWVEDAKESGDVGLAEEHGQFCQRTSEIFKEMEMVLGERRFLCSEFLEILKASFSASNMAFIPATIDQVLVGSIERSRHPDVKAVFILGATQKDFPIPISDKSLLNEIDRRAALRYDFDLGPGTAERLSQRYYLAYIAFTRASKMLYISRPMADSAGRCLCRSDFLENITELFSDFAEKVELEVWAGEEAISTCEELAGSLCAKVRGEKDGIEELGAIRRGLEGRPGFGGVLEIVDKAVGYDNKAELIGDAAGMLADEGEVKISASRIESFANCPYRHFASYALGLNQRRQAELDALDLGSFYHEVMERVVKKLLSESRDIAEIDDAELSRVCSEVCQRVIETEGKVAIFGNKNAHNAYVLVSAVENLQQLTGAIKEMAGAGGLRPIAAEVGFGLEDAVAGARLKTAKGRELMLRGKIDRVDAAMVEGERVCVIFDYKTSAKRFSWRKFYYGLDMQLPLYLLAFVESGALAEKFGRPVGTFYMPILSSAQAGELEKFGNDLKFDRKASGIFDGRYYELLDSNVSGRSDYYNFGFSAKDQQYGWKSNSGALGADEFQRVLEYAEGKVCELSDDLCDGNISVRPVDIDGNKPCSWCPYRCLCRYDWQINEANYIGKLGRDDIFGACGKGEEK
jgi:ATP-dependent helicase/nuclease subunit B